MQAGRLKRRVIVERLSSAQDALGQPVATWVQVGKLWTNPKHETGMGVIRGQREPGVPSSVVRYSFEARREAVRAYGVNVGMRLRHDGLIFDIKAISENLEDRDGVFLVCEQGGSNG